MTPALFALVDAVLWSHYAGNYGYMRRMRGCWKRAGLKGHERNAHCVMAKYRVESVGWWRSLWPLGGGA